MLSPAYPRAHAAMTAVLTPDRPPRRHQAVAVAMILREWERGGGFALLHDMGTGKTLTAMSAFAIMAARGDAQTMLVCCPTSVASAWATDAEHVPGVDVVLLTGKDAKQKAQRVRQLRAELDGRIDPSLKPIARGANDPLRPVIVVTNYESTWRDHLKDALKEFGFDVVACDESQRIKAPGSKQSMMAAALARGTRRTRANQLSFAPYRIIMTGTPMSEGTVDVYGQYRFVDDSIFGRSFMNFKAGFFNEFKVGPPGRQFPKIEPRPDRADELLRRIMSIAHVVRSEDVLELPEESERVVLFDLPPKARRIYDELEAECVAEFGDEFGVTDEIVAEHILTKMLRLQEIAGGGIRAEGSDRSTDLHDEGTKLLVAELQLAKENGLRSVVFHRFTREGDAIMRALAKARDPKLVPVQILASMDAAERAEQIRRFQAGEGDVFVTQIRLGGLGVTLTGASESMFYSTGHSGEEHQQARRRTWRMGQTRPVRHTYFAARDTVQEEVVVAIQEKRDAAEHLLSGGWKRYLRRRHSDR